MPAPWLIMATEESLFFGWLGPGATADGSDDDGSDDDDDDDVGGEAEECEAEAGGLSEAGGAATCGLGLGWGRVEVQVSAPLPCSASRWGAFVTVFVGRDQSFTVDGLAPQRTYRCRVRPLGAMVGFGGGGGGAVGDVGFDGGCEVGPWSAEARFETLRGPSFTFDRGNVGPTVFVSGDGLQATYGGQEMWQTIIGTVPFRSCPFQRVG
jgi:hypothetical protein